MPRVEAPEGWVKKVERAREGKVWVGYFHVWETTPDGHSVRRKKEKTLGAATKPKHEVVKQLAEYIAEHTGKLAKQGESISTFAELWTAFSAVKSGQRSKKTKENLACLFGKHVLPEIGRQRKRDVTLTPLQLLLNKLAEDRFSKSVVGQIRTYVKSCFEYPVDESLIPKSPGRKLVMPKIRKKPCERFLSVEEFRALLSDAPPREHVVLRIFGVCGLRPAEVLVLRIEDFEGAQLRIDEALKERQAGEDRIGDTKTIESDNFVPVLLTCNARSKRGALRFKEEVQVCWRYSDLICSTGTLRRLTESCPPKMISPGIRGPVASPAWICRGSTSGSVLVPTYTRASAGFVFKRVAGPRQRDTQMRRRETYAGVGASGDCAMTKGERLADTRPSRAVSRNRNIGTTSVSGVRPDRFDHQVEFIGAVNLAPYAIRLIRRDELGFSEVEQTINALGVAVLHQDHRARSIFRPRELDQLAQARW